MAEKQYSTFPGSQQRLTTEEQRGSNKSHKCWFIALIIFNVLDLLSVFALNGLNASGSSIFNSTPGDQSDKYYIEITPAGWTFTIWGFIYAWQAAWVLYSVVNIFRRPTPQGPPAYLSPLVLTPALFVLYILANFSNTAWLFLFDQDEILGACISLFLISFFLIGALGVSYKALSDTSAELVKEGRTKDVWLVRGLVQNGLGIYATWTSIASLLNLAIVLTYTDGSDVSMSTASTIALGVLSAEIAVFVVTDLAFLDRYSRYTLTPYIVVVVALIGSISKNWKSGATNSIFTAVLLGVGSVALVVKVVLSIYRHLTRPLMPRHMEPTIGSGNGRLA